MLLCDTFCSSRSTLFRNRMTDIFSNIMLFTIVWKMFRDSWTLLVFLSSRRTWSYSEVEAMKRILVTESKHWNHFCLWVLWPPTSTKRKGTLQVVIKKSRSGAEVWGLPTCRFLFSSQSPPLWFSDSRECLEGSARSPQRKFYQCYRENIARSPSAETRFSYHDKGSI